MLNRAMMAHATIKRRMKRGILRLECVDAETIKSDRTCEFGVWLYGDGIPELGHLPEFTRLRTVHKAFHDAAYKALRLADIGQAKEARNVVDTGEFELRSRDMTTAITMLKLAAAA